MVPGLVVGLYTAQFGHLTPEEPVQLNGLLVKTRRAGPRGSA